MTHSENDMGEKKRKRKELNYENMIINKVKKRKSVRKQHRKGKCLISVCF